MYKSVLRPFSIFLAIVLLPVLYAAEREPIAFGNVEIGDNRLDLSENDFQITHNIPSTIATKLFFKKKSLQWVRIDDILLVPRARLMVYFKTKAENINLRYRDHSLHLQQEKNFSYTEFYVSLFQHDPIEVFEFGKKIGEIHFNAKKVAKDRQTILVDYSCSRYKIDVGNMQGEFMTIGCKTIRTGVMGKEIPMVELYWLAANYKLIDKSEGPYMAVMNGPNTAMAHVINHHGENKNISFQTQIPKRIHRLGTALGFGPYVFHTSFKETPESAIDKKEVPYAPALMLYFNFYLSDAFSIRGFDALVAQESIFNNAGFYLANEVGRAFDRKLIITTLLGVQALYFKFDNDTNTINEPIFPQGIEFTYNHPFGQKNSVISGGVFVSPNPTITRYQNLWIRYNSWELNYIYWGKAEFDAKMWGLSYIVPFVRLF